MTKRRRLSIIICTYNRCKLLSKVLSETLRLINEESEIILIDNNSSDRTQEEVRSLQEKHSNLLYYLETNQGLSFARNRGVSESNSDWCFFLDDDGLPDADLFDKLYEYIDNGTQSIVGGHYYPWYYYGQKKWSKDYYYSNYSDISVRCILEGSQRLSGGILLIEKELFLKFGLFNTDLGMKGDEIGFDEETELQDRFVEGGYTLMYDPSLKMAHVVASQKLETKWFFDAKKAKSKALYLRYSNKRFFYLITSPIIAFCQALILSLRNVPRLFLKDFYVNNFVIESYSKPYKWMCLWMLILSKRFK